MGHVIALEPVMRFKATAPSLSRRWVGARAVKQQIVNPQEDSVIGMSGRLGLGAALVVPRIGS